tara:strand:- start:533 stop:916 length:384 start_codon:yes stop_codon:yes gene_type:complete
MSRLKIKKILQNYNALNNDIYRIEKKTQFLKAKKKELGDILTQYLTKNKLDKLGNITLVTSERKESFSQKYLQKSLLSYYRNYYLSNKSKLQTINISAFSKQKTAIMLKFLLHNRSITKYHRLKVDK